MLRISLVVALVLWGLALPACCPVCKEASPASPRRPAVTLRAKVDGPPARVVFLARHGRTDMNRISQIGGQLHGVHLDALGYKQRVGLFLLLKDEPIRAIFTSTLRRTIQTAVPLAAHFGLVPVASADLNEFRGGVSEGICYSLLGKHPLNPSGAGCDMTSDDPLVKRAEAFLKAENRRRFKVGVTYRWPGGGESLVDVDKRLTHFLRSVPMSLSSKTILIVGHSGANRFLLAKMMGWKMLDALRVRMDNTDVFRIERRAGQPPLLKVFHRGKWLLCDQPPTFRRGLPCLKRARKPKPTPPPTK